MALEIDLEAIQGSAKDAIKAQQTELNVALGAAGKPLIAVDGIVGPQTLQAIDDVAELGKEVVVDKNCPAGQHWDEGLQQCVDDEPAGTETPKETEAEKKLREDNEQLRKDTEALRKDLNAERQKALNSKLKNEALQLANQENSMDVLADLVQRYGLPSTITDFLSEQMIEGESELGIAQKIRARPEYAARFPAMAIRRGLNLPTISEAEYIGLERSYRSIMRAADLPANFHDKPDDFTNLISGDVSAQEFQQRVTLAEAARDTANQDIINELQDNYGLTTGDITAYYLDPKAAENVFEERRVYEAAGLSVAAMQSIGQGLEVDTAKALQRENIQRREIQSRLGQRAGLTEGIIGSEGMTGTDIAEAEFGLDVDEATRLRRLREERLAPMMGRGSSLVTGSGIAGLGEAT